MKENFKIIFCLGIVFLSSFFVLGLFLDAYSQGLLTSEKNIITVGGIVNQNPKQVTLDVLQNILGDVQTDDVNINSLGFRGTEFQEIKPDNTFRIFLLGGSQMFGTGATSDNTTIPGYLEKYFYENDKPFNIEIINSGLKGVDSRKELLLLENILLNYKPDLVIVYDGLNDLRIENSATKIFDNWNSMCELGQKNNFDVIITLQPIAGFGKKSLTEEELVYVQNGKDHNDNSLIDSFDQYEIYANNLQKLQNCSNKLDLRYIFDNEIKSIYIDEAHVSDEGNSIVAEFLIPHISSSIPEKLILNKISNSNDEIINSNNFLEFEYVIENILLNFERKLMPANSFLDQSKTSSHTNQSDKIIGKTQSQLYENDEIYIVLEIQPLQNKFTNEKIIKLKSMSKTNDSIIHNVTYLMTITKNDSELFTNYFFAEDELIIKLDHDSNQNIKISGDRKYEMNAFTMNQETPIIISGSFFESGNKYNFDIGLRTIYESENYVFLDGYEIEINP